MSLNSSPAAVTTAALQAQSVGDSGAKGARSVGLRGIEDHSLWFHVFKSPVGTKFGFLLSIGWSIRYHRKVLLYTEFIIIRLGRYP